MLSRWRKLCQGVTGPLTASASVQQGLRLLRIILYLSRSTSIRVDGSSACFILPLAAMIRHVFMVRNGTRRHVCWTFVKTAQAFLRSILFFFLSIYHSCLQMMEGKRKEKAIAKEQNLPKTRGVAQKVVVDSRTSSALLYARRGSRRVEEFVRQSVFERCMLF